MKNDHKKLLDKHAKLIQTDNMKVNSHVQREDGDWIINTIMVENVSAPFKYKRKTKYQSLDGQRVNLTYYPTTETVAGFDIEVMNVVRIKRS
ncbi:hypothetical protein [Colwellia sp. MEBiC06753]